jgi:hypothetical protein
LTIDSSGNLGLGVTPSAWGSGFRALEVGRAGSGFFSVGTDSLQITNNYYYNGTNYIYAANGFAERYHMVTGQHQWYTAPSGTAGNAISFTQSMTLDSSGNLLVGKTSSGATGGLELVANVAGLGFGRLYLNTGYGSPANSVVFAYNGSTVGIIQQGTAATSYFTNGSAGTGILGIDANTLGFSANGSERARITSGGDLLVGTTSTTYGSIPGKFTSCSATAGSAGLFYTGFSGDVSTSALNVGKFDNNSTTSQIFMKFGINNANNGSGQINANGAGAAAFGSFSDRRLKENIVDLPSQLSKIMALRPVEFDYIESEGGGHQTGFIAQEIQEVYPDTVSERVPDGMLTVTGWSKTEARLVKAIQELKAEFDAYKASHP